MPQELDHRMNCRGSLVADILDLERIRDCEWAASRERCGGEIDPDDANRRIVLRDEVDARRDVRGTSNRRWSHLPRDAKGTLLGACPRGVAETGTSRQRQ